MYGMRSRPIMMGDNKIIINTTKNINVGSVIGKYWAILNISDMIKISAKIAKSYGLSRDSREFFVFLQLKTIWALRSTLVIKTIIGQA